VPDKLYNVTANLTAAAIEDLLSDVDAKAVVAPALGAGANALGAAVQPDAAALDLALYRNRARRR
jgi:hypothetical protein